MLQNTSRRNTLQRPTRGRAASQPTPSHTATTLFSTASREEAVHVSEHVFGTRNTDDAESVFQTSELGTSSTKLAKADIEAHTDTVEEEKEAEQVEQNCLICMRKGTSKKPLINIPCKNNCKQNVVHTKCIFEWKEQLRERGTCPLCRGRLGKINYIPPDYLRSDLVRSDSIARKIFNLSPIPKKAGMVRCFLKVKNNPWWGSPFLYDFYMEKPIVKRYPHGPTPDRKSPKEGDILLMSAKKRAHLHNLFSSLTGFNFKTSSISFNLRSSIDISMTKDFDKNSSDFLGSVEASSFTGLEYTVNVNIFQEHNQNLYASSNVSSGGSAATKIHGSSSLSHRPSLDASSISSNGKYHTNKGKATLFGWKKQREVNSQLNGLVQVPAEVACIHYTQNRVGADSGPRKMKVSFPQVCKVSKAKGSKMLLGQEKLPDFWATTAEKLEDNLKENSKKSSKAEDEKPNNDMFSNIEDFSSDEESDDESTSDSLFCEFTSFHRPENSKESMNKVLRRKRFGQNQRYTSDASSHGEQSQSRSFLFGKNKEPYWLERIQAYSLDFNGRVTLPSNKNFQIELETNEEGNFSMLNGRENDDIVLQFGKVVSADECRENVSIYTVDFKHPLSPIQALGICLSSCDRKFACA